MIFFTVGGRVSLQRFATIKCRFANHFEVTAFLEDYFFETIVKQASPNFF